MVGWIGGGGGGGGHQKSVGVFIYLYGPANVNSVTLLILRVLKEKYTALNVEQMTFSLYQV